VQLEAFGKPVRSTDGLCAHADGTDEPLRSTTSAFNASSAALDSFVAASVSVDNYRVDVRYKFSLGGLRGAPRAVVRANERLTVPSTQDVLEFRDELVFEAGSVMQITVRNAGAVAASSTKIKANRATVRCILTVVLDNYTPTAFQKSKAAFTVEVPAMFDIPTRNVAFDSVVTAPMIANYTPSASVSSTGALLLVFTQIGLASTTGTPSTPAPGGAVIVTPVPVVPTTTTTDGRNNDGGRRHDQTVDNRCDTGHQRLFAVRPGRHDPVRCAGRRCARRLAGVRLLHRARRRALPPQVEQGGEQLSQQLHRNAAGKDGGGVPDGRADAAASAADAAPRLGFARLRWRLRGRLWHARL
jgi:hypothetical protein